MQSSLSSRTTLLGEGKKLETRLHGIMPFIPSDLQIPRLDVLSRQYCYRNVIAPPVRQAIIYQAATVN